MNTATENAVSLHDLMLALLDFKEPTPCYLYSRTFPPLNKYGRSTEVKDGKEVRIQNPFIHYDKDDEKGKPKCKIIKYSKQMIRVNDNYESAVIRRQILEAANKGEVLRPDDLFVADRASWGAKVDKDAPPLFEWWIPTYTREILFYMAYRPVQHIETWYEWEEDCDGHKAGDRLTAEEVATLKKEYLAEKDEYADADRQEVDKAVLWRKLRFDGVLAMSIGGERYSVTDNKMPEVPKARYEELMKMLGDRDQRQQMAERIKLEEKAAKAAAKLEKAKAKLEEKESRKVVGRKVGVTQTQ